MCFGGKIKKKTPCDRLTTQTVSTICRLCDYVSWMEPLIDSDDDLPEKLDEKAAQRLAALASDGGVPLPRSVYNSANQHMDVKDALRRTLFNDCFRHLLLNFSLWRRKDMPLEVQMSVIDAVDLYVSRQPQYFRALLPVGEFLHEIRRYYRYSQRTIGDGHRDTLTSTWKLRQRWSSVLLEMICYGNGKGYVFFEVFEEILNERERLVAGFFF